MRVNTGTPKDAKTYLNKIRKYLLNTMCPLHCPLQFFTLRMFCFKTFVTSPFMNDVE